MRCKLWLATLAVLALAATAAAQTKISGTVHCSKPDPQHSVEVGDRPGHALAIGQSKCSWTKPMEIAGIQTKEDIVSVADDMRGTTSRTHGYAVGTLSNGDKMFVRIQGTGSLKDGSLESAEGNWGFTGGTGKVKGLKGKGTYKGKAEGDGITYEVEGEYELPK